MYVEPNVRNVRNQKTSIYFQNALSYNEYFIRGTGDGRRHFGTEELVGWGFARRFYRAGSAECRGKSEAVPGVPNGKVYSVAARSA